VRNIKYLIYAIGAVGLLLAVGAIGLTVLGMPKFEVAAPTLEVDKSAARVQRGRQLARMLCLSCHYNTNERRLQGAPLTRVPWRIGNLQSPNITKHAEHGIGSWTDGEVAFALRTGVHPKTEQLMLPVMPRWPAMATEDLEAIVAFLRSDDPMVAEADVARGRPRVTLRAKLFARLKWQPSDYPAQPIPVPDADDPVVYGKYLVDSVLQCHRCHSASLDAIDYADPPQTPGYLGGGAKLDGVALKTVRAANLTSHASGLKDWTAVDLRHALIDGFRPDGAVLRWPMHRFADLSVGDVEAIYAYLRTVPPIASTIERPEPRRIGSVADPGLHALQKYGCVHCHGETGEGLADLRGLDKTFPSDKELIAFLKDPSTSYEGTVMPKYDGVVEDGDYAALCGAMRRISKAREEAFAVAGAQ